MPSQFNNSKGFTLLELLVVISIIGLMASIVLVSLDIARERAVIAKGLQFGSSIYHAHGDELVGFWNFNNGDGTDSSGYGNHGTLNGAPVPSDDSPNDALGKSLDFNGNSDYIDCGNDKSLDFISSNNYTFEAWVNIYSTAVFHNPIIGKYKTAAPFGGYLFYLRPDNRKLEFKDTDSDESAVTGFTSLNYNRWYHVVVSYENQNVTLFLNGTEDGNNSHVFENNIVSNIEIGRFTTYNDYFNGKIDEVRIYKTALSAAEIQKHYAEGAERHGITLK